MLLENLLSDLPSLAIATDNVDAELVDLPKRWNIKFITNFMIVFGLLSSVFDYLTFGILYFLFHTTPSTFRTGWFLESVICASTIALIIRTRRVFLKSKPSKYLLAAFIFAISLLVICYTFKPLASLFSFTPVPNSFILVLGAIVILHIIAAEIVKVYFYKKVSF